MSWEKIEELKKKLTELDAVQKKVDAALAKMPAGKEKDRLLKMKQESRGFFSDYVLPGWKKIQSLIGDVNAAFGDYEGSNTIGALPLIPIAAVLAATSLVGYTGTAIYREIKILNDPALTASQKAEMLKSAGPGAALTAVSDISSNISKVAFLLGGLFILGKFGPLIAERFKKQ